MGCIQRIGKNKFRIIYDTPKKDGRRKQKTETLEPVTEREAKAILAKREEAVAGGEYEQDTIMLGDLLDKFLAHKRARTDDGSFSPNTLDRYEGLIDNYLRPAFGHLAVKELKRIHLLDKYEAWLKDGPCKRKITARTVLHAHDLLRTTLNWGQRRELVTRNVAALLTRDELPKAKTPEPYSLTEKGLRELLTVAQSPTKSATTQRAPSSQPWFAPAVLFASGTGCRRAEVLAVRWSDVDFDALEVNVQQALTRRLTFKAPKNGKSRRVSLGDLLVKTLKQHKAAQDEEKRLLGPAYQDNDLVFALADGSAIPPRQFGSAVRRLLHRIGERNATLHNLRDTHASLSLKEGVPIEVVSKRLGHANTAITMQRYVHVFREQDMKAARAFDKLIS